MRNSHDPLNTNTDAVIEDEDMPEDTSPAKPKRNYFAIYHSPALLEAVENARGDESANAFLTRLICNQLNVPVPERKTRRRFSSPERATEVHELEQDMSAEAERIMAQKAEYAKLLADAAALLG